MSKQATTIETLTADYWQAIDDTLVAYQAGRIDVDTFASERWHIHQDYREAVARIAGN